MIYKPSKGLMLIYYLLINYHLLFFNLLINQTNASSSAAGVGRDNFIRNHKHSLPPKLSTLSYISGHSTELATLEFVSKIIDENNG